MKFKIGKSILLLFVFLLFSQFTFAATQNVQLSKQWNLVGSELDNVAVSQFNNSAVSSVWSWDVTWQKWKGWSPNSTIVSLMQQYKMDIVNTINAGEGFWVNTTAPLNLTLSGDSPSISNLSLAKQWNLLSVKDQITVDDLNKAEVSSVWTWDVTWQKWKGWSPNSAIVSLMQQYKMDIVNSIAPGEGFWVNASAPLEIKFGEAVKSGYYVYQYLEGSAPIPLSSVKIYKILDNGSFSDLDIITDSTGYASVNVPDNTSLAFVKEGFSTITYSHEQGKVVNIFMTQSSEKNLQLLMPPSVGTSSVKKSASSSGKSIQSPDSSATATFYNFSVKDEYKNYSAKLSYVPGKNLKLIEASGNKYIPVAGIELTLATETGGALFEEFKTISSDATAYATGSIQLDEKLSDFLNQLVNQKKATELQLFVFDPSNPLDGWHLVDNSTVTLNADSETISFEKMDRFAFYAIAFKKPKKLEQEVYFKAVDSDNASLVLAGVNINILGQSVVTDESGLAKIQLILPSGGTVKVEAYYTDDYNPFKGFYKVSDLKESSESAPILLFLDKKNKENILTLKVEDSSDNSSIPFANLKIYTYTSLGNINHDGEYIYVGKEPGAEYSWFIKAHTISSASTSSILVSSVDGVKKIKVSATPSQITGETLSKISLDSIVNFLKEKYEGDIVGDFDLIAHVKHVNGYEEEGTIALLDLQFNGEEMLGDGSNITKTDSNNILNIDTDEWIFDFNNPETVNIWQGCILDNGSEADNCSNFNYETLVKDDLVEFLSENAQFILSHTDDSLAIKLKAYSCTTEDQDLNTCTSATVNIPLTTTGDILDVFADVMPATDIPAIIETTADANGEFPFIVPVDSNGKKLPDIVVNASKLGYKTAKGKKVSTDETEYTISLKKLSKIDYTITVVDSSSTDALENAAVTVSDAILDNTTGKLKDVSGTSDSNGKVVLKGIIEGIHNLVVFKDGYEPYEGKIRVSAKISSKTVKLTENSGVTFDDVVEPFIEFENPVIINGELLIKGNVYDTDNDTYSGATKLQVKFNGSVESLSISDDGSFQFRKALVEGRNSINLFAVNPKGKFSTGTMFFYYKAIEQDKVMISGNVVDVNDSGIKFTSDSYVYVTIGNGDIEFPLGDNNSFSMILKGISDGDSVVINAVAYDDAGNVYYGDEEVEVGGEEVDNVLIKVETETNDKLQKAYDEKHDDLQITKVQYSLKGKTYFDVTGIDKVNAGKVLIKAYLNAYIKGFTNVSATIENSDGFLDVSDVVSDNSSEGTINFPLNLAYGENFITITVTNPPTAKNPEPYVDSFDFTLVYQQITTGVTSTIPFTFKFTDKATGKAPEKDLTVFIEKPSTGEIIDILDSWKLKSMFKKCGNGFIEPRKTATNAKFTVEIKSKYYKDLKLLVDVANDKSIDNATVCGQQVKFKEIDLPLAGQFGVGKEEGVSLEELQNSGHVEIWPEPEKICKGTDGTLQIEGWFDIPEEHLKYKVYLKSADNETFSTVPLAEIVGKFNTKLIGGKNLDNGSYDVKIDAYYLDNMSEPIGTNFTSFDIEDCGENWQQPAGPPMGGGINPFHPPLIKLLVDNSTIMDGSFNPETGKISVDNSSANCVTIEMLSNTGGYYEYEITGKTAGYCSAKITLTDENGKFLESIPVNFYVKGEEGGSCDIKEATVEKTGDVTGTAGGVIGFKAKVSLPGGISCPNCKYVWDLDNNSKVDGAVNTKSVTAYFGTAAQGVATVYVFDENEKCVAQGSYKYNLAGDALGGTPPQALDLVMYVKNSTIDVPDCSCGGAGEECSFGNLKACNNQFLCNQVGGFWDGSECKPSIPCSVDNLEGCQDEASCKNNKGAWLPDGAGSGKCVYYDFIMDEGTCNLVGGYWYNGECHKEAFSGQCAPGNVEDCISPDACKKAEGLWIQLTFIKGECLDPDEISQEDVCEKAGGFWENNECSLTPPTAECTPNTPEKCYTKESCEDLGKALWIVNNFGKGTCMTLDDINDKYICAKFGGYWYDEQCNASPNECTSDNLTACMSPFGCYAAGGYWYNNSCHDNPGDMECKIDNATVTITGYVTGTGGGNIGFKANVSFPNSDTCDNCTYVWDLDNNGKVDGKPIKTPNVTAFYGTNGNGAYTGKAVVEVFDGVKCIAKGSVDVDLAGDSLGATPPTTLDVVVYTPNSQLNMPMCSCNNPVPSGCSMDNLTACMSESDCAKVQGYWYNNQCNATPEGSECSFTNLSACSEQACSEIGGYWYNNTCNQNEQGGDECNIATVTIAKTGDIEGSTGGAVGFKATLTLPTEIMSTDNTYVWDLDNDGKVDGKIKQLTVNAYYGAKNDGTFSGKAVVYVLDGSGKYVGKGEIDVDLQGDALGATPPTALDLVALPVTPGSEDVPSCQ